MNDVPLVETWDRLAALLAPFLVRCGAAALCGAMIGLERERKRKPAGFRTNILICVGAAIYMLVGLVLVNAGGATGDPARIAAQVVTGVGFLGAGAILHSGVSVHGMTTAATIWVNAAVGMAVGAGQYAMASVATAITLLVLAVLVPLEAWFDRRAQREKPRR